MKSHAIAATLVGAVLFSAAAAQTSTMFGRDPVLQSVAMATPPETQRAGVDPPAGIAVEAKSIATFSARAPDQHRFGMVEYVGGLELISSHTLL